MNIAYVLMRFPTPSETFARRDVEALRQLGHQVEVHPLIFSSRSGGLRYLLSSIHAVFARGNFAAVMRLALRILTSRSWVFSERLKCLALLPSAARIARCLAVKKPDVVHIFWGHYPALVTLLAKPLLPNTRFSLFLGAYDLELRLPLSCWAASVSDVICTHAQANHQAIGALLGDRTVQTIHRGIELDGYPSTESLAFEKRRLRIFTAGRLIPEKGFDKVIKCFSDVVKAFPTATLVVAGTGPDLIRLKKLCSELGLVDQVTFAGWLSEDGVRKHLVESRVFMLLSSKPGERLPNSVKEAMAAGCIAITSFSPGMDELIEHGLDGFILEREDDYAVAEAIRFAFCDCGAAEMSVAAAVKIRQAFDVQRAMQHYIECWERANER